MVLLTCGTFLPLHAQGLVPQEHPVWSERPYKVYLKTRDEIAGRIDLNRDLVKHPLATFYVRVEGDSMEPRIHSGELLVVDRMAETKDGDIVVARLGCEFTVKRLHTEEDGSIWLISENPSYEPIQITEGMDFEVWGRVLSRPEDNKEVPAAIRSLQLWR